MEDLRYQEIIDHLIMEELLNGGEITLRVSGKSMHPLIRQGDSIRLEKCTPGTLAIGDIITFKKDGNYFTHRVLWKTRKGNRIRLITKGDNEINPDPPVSPDHILGKVVTIGRANRSLHLETPYWRFINRLLGIVFLMETISMLLYRLTVGKLHPLRTLISVNTKPSLLYRNLKSRSFSVATRIIVKTEPPQFHLER
jgi:signal peptidase I